jgi:hypothetical protein
MIERLIQGQPNDPLHRFAATRTSDPEEFRHALVNVYGATGLTIRNPRGLQTRGNFLQLGDIALGFSPCGVPAAVSFAECDFTRLQIALSGRAATTSAGVTAPIDNQQSCLTPGRAALLDYGVGFEHIVLRVNAKAKEHIEEHFADFLYFSATSYSTLGIGDVYPVGVFRLISGIESINGLFLIAWSTSFTYFVMDRLWPLYSEPTDKRAGD